MNRAANIFLAVAIFWSCGCRPETPAERIDEEPPLESLREPEVFPALEPGFERLTLSDFVPFHGEDGTWTEENGVLICSGIPKGYLYSKEPYGNFTLRGEYQFVLAEDQMDKAEKANTGFMLAIQEPHKVWPVSLEVQGRFDTMGSINSNGGLPAVTIEDHPEVREAVRRPVGEWNDVEIVVADGAVTARLNGELICTSEATELKSGLIGLQSEGYVVKFRNLRVKRED